MLGLSVFVVAEGLCVLFDLGRSTEYDDPFVGFSDIHPLFVLDEAGANYVIPKSRLNFFARESFPAKKGPRTFRIFCLGGSTVQGRPYSIQTSFTTWLKLSLQAADGSQNWEVVNCGGISYASYRLVPILEECLRYQPDLFVICTGHNEFLEERTYGPIKHASPLWAIPQRWAGRTRLFHVVRGAYLDATQTDPHTAHHVPVLKDEVDALLDYNRGIEAYHRDEAWRAGVIAHYENNVRRMIAMCRGADVPVILIRPPSNLRDTPPFKSQHKAGLTDAELQTWESLVEAAKTHYRSDLPTAIHFLEQAIAIDDQFAVTFYELGKCYDTLGLREQARAAYWQARELDICPLRILAPMERALKQVAEDTGTPLIDAFHLLEEKCPCGILGDRMLVDHVHPTFEGHQMIADAIAAQLVAQGDLQPDPDWDEKRRAVYKAHFDSLPTIYFLRGRETLRALEAWTQGRADGPPIESRNGIVEPN